MTPFSTRFGPLPVAADQIWQCPVPLAGFPELQRFALIHVDKQGPFIWLQSLDDRLISFLLLAPEHLGLGYVAPAHLPRSALPMVMAILPPHPNAALDANRQAPLFFDAARQHFHQWVVEYPHPQDDPAFSTQPPAELLNKALRIAPTDSARPSLESGVA